MTRVHTTAALKLIYADKCTHRIDRTLDRTSHAILAVGKEGQDARLKINASPISPVTVLRSAPAVQAHSRDSVRL